MFNQSGLFFVPKRWQSAGFLRWLKRIHAWTGFWGALFFLLLGTSGFLLNHRTDKLKIDTGEPIELPLVELPVTPGTIRDAESLGAWAKKTLNLPVEGQAPRGPGGSGAPGGAASAGSGERAGGREARFMGQDVAQPEKWTRNFTMPDVRVSVEYVAGANFVTAKREEINFLGVIKNLHKGTGLPIGWILLIDTIAGADRKSVV